MLAYLDSSAVTKLVAREAETPRLRGALAEWPRRVSSKLVRVEVMRAALKRGKRQTVTARVALDDLVLLSIDDRVVDIATALDPPPLRALDAIHVATALSLGNELGALITYDLRMQEAARTAGIRVVAPA